MFGRTTAVTVLMVLTLGLAACSSDAGDTDSTSATDEDASDTASDDDASTATSDDGSSDGDADADDEADGSGDGGDGGTGAAAGEPTATQPVEPFEPGSLEWDEYDDDTDVALLDVPVDYRDPDGDQFELFLARHRALDPEQRIGTLLINPGGPGFGGSDYALFATQIFDIDLLDRFDIVGWDPRGTGESTPAIDCIDDYDPYFTAVDLTPADEAARTEVVGIAANFAEACETQNAAIIDHVGTNDSARDMDAIRRALGEDTISFFGFSYGSELGATWATMFPDTVRAAVLDGAADPNADALESSLQQSAGFEQSIETFLERCSTDDECEFHNDGDAMTAFVDLLAQLDATPLTVEPDRPPVNRDVAITATVQAMYSESYWPALERALADAAEGDAAGLLALSDAYYQRQPDGTYGNELEAFQAISCADTADRPTVEETDAEVPQFREVAPLLVPEGSVGSYFCTFFPPAADPRVEITGAGAGPIVVIGTTGDPATPLESTQRMAEALEDGRLVIVEADQHTGYGVNRCVIDVVNDYLIDLEPPESGTECR
jgi:pimeloyl-ACP methyl ester carboxylesterase